MSRKISAVPHRRLFIQRIRGGNRPQVALIQFRLNLYNLHRHRLALRSEGFAIAKKQGHIPAPLPQRRQRIAVDRRVRI